MLSKVLCPKAGGKGKNNSNNNKKKNPPPQQFTKVHKHLLHQSESFTIKLYN